MSKEIYIKIKPSFRYLTEEEAMAAMQNVEFSDEVKKLNGFLQNVGIKYEDLCAMCGAPYAVDWNGCNDFWTCEQDENGKTMVSHPVKGQGIKMAIKKEKDLEEYVNLDDFVKKGAYIGKYFRRTHLITPDDKEFLPVNHDIFVLYANDGVLLSARNNNGKPFFEVIPRRFSADGKYEYYGDEKTLYDDPKATRKGIIKQLTNTNENKL